MIRPRFRAFTQLFMLLLLITTLAGGPAAQTPALAATHVLAYVFYGNNADAVDFQGMLTAAMPGYTVDLIPLSDVLSKDFSAYDLVLMADDTGSLGAWGTPSITTAQVAQITAANIPVIGIGEGGYAFFGKLGLYIGWPNGWHSPQTASKQAATAQAGMIFGALPSPLALYTEPVNTVGIFLPGAPADTVAVGLETGADDHADQIIQGCRFLWGSGGGPAKMTSGGKALFVSSIQYALKLTCPVEQPPNQKTFNVVKTADPVNGAAVAPGQVIDYTLSYLFDSTSVGGATSAVLKDQIPMDTVFVPGSASDSISPSPGGELTWMVSPGSGVKHFKVVVSDTQCANQSTVNNQASLHAAGYTEVLSNPVYHPVTCPPVVFPNSSIFYAEDEVTVHPYPLIAGRQSRVSVRLTNDSTATSPVTVQFQAAPLGIGMVYTTFDTQTVTLPAGGVTEITSLYSPVASEQASFQILISGSPPQFTQSSLDVSEDFKPGVPDTLAVPVRNNTLSSGDVTLVVDNTCPGWTAVVEPATLPGLAAGDTGVVNLTVTPPVSIPLGTGCHIDLQAWIGTKLIGGIRKLDVPPVHLPTHVNPPWEEPEIVTVPDPPVAGVPGQLCVDLVNPLGVSKDVTVEFNVADFGAGIPFTPAASTPAHLPAHSSGRYCANWTPAGTGTLHQCILATLKQPGFLDMSSQRNVNVVRSDPATLASVAIPFRVSNPDGIAHHLTFQITSVGIDPSWTPHIRTPKGDPVPDVLMGDGSVHDLLLGFTGDGIPAAPFAAQAASYRTGGESKVEVAILLDGRQVGGFTVSLQIGLFLPILSR